MTIGEINWKDVDWESYESAIQILIENGLDHSDAEGVVEAEMRQAPALHRIRESI